MGDQSVLNADEKALSQLVLKIQIINYGRAKCT